MPVPGLDRRQTTGHENPPEVGIKYKKPPSKSESNTRNRLPGANCTEIESSCLGVRGVPYALAEQKGGK
eukprot:3468126-Rhodomonas_salina.1